MHVPFISSLKDHLPRFALPAISLLLGSCSSIRSVAPGPDASRDSTVKLQIFLDSQNFGPGVVDGHSGEFTRKALSLYQESANLPPESRPDLSGITPFTTYTLTAADLGAIGSMGGSPAEISKQEKSPYTSVIELVSERFHTSQTYLRKLNSNTDINSLPAGSAISVPNVRRPFRFDRFPSTYPAATAAAASGRTILVDTRLRMLEIRDSGKVVAAFPITPGSSEHPALPGELRVVGAVPWPWYRYDEGVLDRGERTDTFHNLPPGPNSPVGILWTGLNRPGVGIHGTTTPDTIGRSGSHGCIRLSNWDAATFHTFVRKDMPVTIR